MGESLLVYDGNDLAYFYITTTMIIKAYLNGDKRVTPFFFFFLRAVWHRDKRNTTKEQEGRKNCLGGASLKFDLSIA